MERIRKLAVAVAVAAAVTTTSSPVRAAKPVAACEGDSPKQPFKSPVVTQTFTAGSATTISAVDVRLQWSKTVESKLQVRIVYWPDGAENDAAPTPNVVDVGRSLAYRFKGQAGTKQWVTFKFAKPVELLPAAVGSGAAYGVAVDSVEGKNDSSPTPTPAVCATPYPGGAAYTGAGNSTAGQWPGKAKPMTSEGRVQYDVQFRVHP